MPVLHINQLRYQFDNGDVLFEAFSCSLTDKRVGLVGRNGAGKSLLTELILGEREPSKGKVVFTLPQSKVGRFQQLPSTLLESSQTLAEFLGIDGVLHALVQIEAGCCEPHWFEVVGEQWTLRESLLEQLAALKLPDDTDFPCCQLSGGQLTRLQLWRLFNADTELLILDEPSNHLDAEGKQWLQQAMRSYAGHILLISHDRELLNEMETIWELSASGVTAYGGNYQHYAQQKALTVNALERQMDALRKQQKKLEAQAQLSFEKAQQRASQGNKVRASGGQPKILLNAKRNSATSAASARAKNEQHRRESLSSKAKALQDKYQSHKAQKLHIAAGQTRNGSLAVISQGQLPFGDAGPVNFAVSQGMKIQLVGRNGSGKSTLLKVLDGCLALEEGERRLSVPTYYLDQHFGALNAAQTVLGSILDSVAGVTESDARTLLAGIGFRRDSVHRKVGVLSGGERMKLAMIIATQQRPSPLLLLDEPDNHLDIESKQILAAALHDYTGTLILVSHDPVFVEECGITQQFQLQLTR
uniref:ABC-F family ATP-binding cassette domain-containing protein n=1 Tax=Thaumasiovibrio occultus TaxID=1891184 RepID=UPI000B35714B|nr:ATP-binding cassette domain-containing protein [Thaumasiovibrio occultus]